MRLRLTLPLINLFIGFVGVSLLRKQLQGSSLPGHPVTCSGLCASRPMTPLLPPPKWMNSCKLKLTKPSKFLQAIAGLNVNKAPGPKGIPQRVLRHLPKHAITLLTKVFNAVFLRQYFSPAWDHARVVPILKPGKDHTLPLSYRPLCLLDTVRKIF